MFKRLVVVGWIGWSLLALAIVADLQLSRPDPVADLSCPISGVDSAYAPSEWQWWPPGRVCVDDGRKFDPPSNLGADAIVVAGVLAVGLGSATLVLLRDG